MGTIGFGGLCQIHGPYARTPMGNWFTVAVSGELGSWVHREWNRIKICFAFFFYFTNRTVSFFFFFFSVMPHSFQDLSSLARN